MRSSVRTTLILLFVSLLAVRFITARSHVQVVDQRLGQMPTAFDGWKGEDRRYSASVYRVLDADGHLLRKYSKDGVNPIWLYIGYYGTQKGGRTGHLPQYCLPGAGYRLSQEGKAWVPGPDGQSVRVNTVVAERGKTRVLMLYWIHSGDGQVLDSGWKMNVNRFRRRLRENRDDGAFVRLSSAIPDGKYEEILAREIEFASNVLVQLPHSWPIER